MSISNLPPQAYTRDTVLEAFNWLNSQPESVRQLAKNEDALVSLYLRAKRFGGVGSPLEQEAPVSSKKFKDDLKTLAKGLQDFDRPGPSAAAPRKAAAAKTQHQAPAAPAPDQQQRPQAPQEPPPSSFRLGLEDALLSGLKSHPSSAPTLSVGHMELDPLSQRQIRRAMDILNLSSESEALRLLITLGSQRVQKLLD